MSTWNKSNLRPFTKSGKNLTYTVFPRAPFLFYFMIE